MRLVDASEATKAVEKVLQKYGMNRESIVTDEVHDAIDNIPTAYDVDNVVEQLEEEREFSYANFDEYVEEVSPCLDAEYHDTFSRGLERAARIVKDGVRTDDVCEWKLDYGFVSDKYKRETSCGYTFYDLHHAVAFKYCPYCGKKIKVVE